MKKELILVFEQLTVCLDAAIEMRDRRSNMQKTMYRKLARKLEQSLKALESAINLIGE